MSQLLSRFDVNTIVKDLDDEEKALLEAYILKATCVKKTQSFVTRLSQIHRRILNQTEDISDDELQEIANFTLGNADVLTIIEEIERRK